MKSQTVSSTATSRSYRASAGGEPSKGSPTPPVKPFDINDHDFSGELQELSDDTNLSTPWGSEDTSQTNSKSDPSQQQFGSRSSVDDGSRDADSASEDSDFVTPPANTPRGPAQPTVQFSEDPAIAALQKSTLAATTQVVLYATCLAILENALADPQCKLPPNSFSCLRSLFGGGIKEGEARAQELTTETEQLLAQHSQDAKALAAQADGDASPAADDTFSVRSSRAAPVDVRRALREVKQLPTQAQQDQIVEGLRSALQNMGPVSDADLEKALRQMQWDLDPMEGVDPEISELYKQLQTEEAETVNANFDNELDMLWQLGKDRENLQDSAAPGKSDPESDDELFALFAELENQPAPPAPTKPQSPRPAKTPLSPSAQLQELIQTHGTLTSVELQDVAIKTKEFQDRLFQEENRPLTTNETTERVLYENQGTRPYRQYLKNKLIDDYLVQQRAIILDSEREMSSMLGDQNASGETEDARQQRMGALLSARRVAVNMTINVGPLKA